MYALKFGYGSLRDEDGSLGRGRGEADSTVLAWPEAVARIRKQTRDTNRAGPDIHVPVREGEPAPVRVSDTVGEDQLEVALAEVCLPQLGSRKAASELEILLF